MTPRSAGMAAAPAPVADQAAPILFSDRGCPFAHRVLALLDHLGAPVERRETAVGAKPAGLEQYSAAKRIPLLVHGDLVLTESRVIAEHLAEYHSFADAYPDDVATRSRHRHAMALLDLTIVPVLFGRKQIAIGDLQLDDALRALAAATESTTPRPCLLSLHAAPMWLRLRWWQPTGTVARAVQARPTLQAWLDATIELACVNRTAPDREAHTDDLVRARQAGLVGPSTS